MALIKSKSILGDNFNVAESDINKNWLTYKRKEKNAEFCQLSTCKVAGTNQNMNMKDDSTELKIYFDVKPEKATNYRFSCHGRDSSKLVTLFYTSPRTNKMSSINLIKKQQIQKFLSHLQLANFIFV